MTVKSIIDFVLSVLSAFLGSTISTKSPNSDSSESVQSADSPDLSFQSPPPKGPVVEQTSRKLNGAGMALIKRFEGLRLDAYLDSVGVPTIGYGSTSGVIMGQKISAERAEELLLEDLTRFEAGVSKCAAVELNDNQFAALVSFSFNLGLGNLQKSTLLKKVNVADFAGAATEFVKWNKAGGKILNGLTARREAERDLFLS